MAANNADTTKPVVAPAGENEVVDLDARDDTGLPGRPMALLLAVGLALLAALIAWAAIGGVGVLAGP